MIYDSLSQPQIDWLLHRSVTIEAMIRPEPILSARGTIAKDGRFDEDGSGALHYVFPEPVDDVFWEPQSDRLGSWCQSVFALGEAAIDNPGTYSFDCALNVFSSPIEWLLARRDGIVVINWPAAFDRLRDCPRVAIAESLLPLYRRHMRPAHLPDVSVILESGRIAA